MKRLGKLAPANDQSTLRLTLPESALSTTPDAVDWYSKVYSWPMDNNDIIGDCTIAGAAHILQGWTTYVGNPVVISPQDVVKAYSDITGYNPSDPNTDRGAVELNVLNYWVTNGIFGHKIDAFASVNPSNVQEVKAAINVFGGIYIGLALPLTAQYQQIWDYVPVSANNQPGSWGGHCVTIQGYDKDGLTCVTWGATKRMTWEFFETYCEEAYALVSKDFLNASGVDPQGLTLAALEEDLNKLKSGVL